MFFGGRETGAVVERGQRQNVSFQFNSAKRNNGNFPFSLSTGKKATNKIKHFNDAVRTQPTEERGGAFKRFHYINPVGKMTGKLRTEKGTYSPRALSGIGKLAQLGLSPLITLENI